MTPPLNMALVGLNFGRHILENQLLNGGPGQEFVRPVGVCDLNQDVAQELATKHALRNYPSLDALLADPAVDVVGLFTGPNGRAALIEKIIRAGKHVMTTKPFERDPAAARAVLEEARARGRVVHLNSPGPVPDAQTAQILAWMREFDLGRLVTVQWETYADYFADADGSWYDDPVQCPVAPIYRLGIYGIHQILDLCGEVERVNVLSTRLRTGRPTVDNALLSLQFRSGALGAVLVSFCVRGEFPYPNNLTLRFERGMIQTTPLEKNPFGTSAFKVRLQVTTDPDHLVEREARFSGDDLPGHYAWSHFFDAVRHGGTVPQENSPEKIVAGIHVIQAMAEAERTGCSVAIPPLHP